MCWEDLRFELGRLVNVWPQPDAVIIHLGGNDIGQVKTLDLIFSMQNTIKQIKLLFPNVVIIFSEIVQRLRWLESCYMRPFEKIRKQINRKVNKFLSYPMGFAFRHVELEGGLPGLYREDGIHLSEIGLDILNLDFQTCIEKAAGWGLDAKRDAFDPSCRLG